jgi:tetratricopeptide (TPR) repeat protein
LSIASFYDIIEQAKTNKIYGAKSMYAENLDLKERADSGDPLAVYEYAKYLEGKDEYQCRQYYKKLAEFTPEEVHFVGYGSLLDLIGTIHYEEGNYREAMKWHEKAMAYIKATYDEEIGRKIIEDITLEASYVKAVLAAHKQEGRL